MLNSLTYLYVCRLIFERFLLLLFIMTNDVVLLLNLKRHSVRPSFRVF